MIQSKSYIKLYQLYTTRVSSTRALALAGISPFGHLIKHGLAHRETPQTNSLHHVSSLKTRVRIVPWCLERTPYLRAPVPKKRTTTPNVFH